MLSRGILSLIAIFGAATVVSASSADPDVGVFVTTGGCARAGRSDPSRSRLRRDRDPAPPDAVLLRVAPWPGCGMQVTLGVGWGADLPDVASSEDDTLDPLDRVHVHVAPVADARPPHLLHRPIDSRVDRPFDRRRSPSRTPPPRTSLPAVATRPAPASSGLTAVALALSPDPAVAATQVDVTDALLDALPPDELVSVWILTLVPDPILVADFRRTRLGGRAHFARRLRAVREALRVSESAESAESAAFESTNVRRPRYDEDERARLAAALSTRTTPRVWEGALGDVSREIRKVQNDPEGSHARDVIVVAPSRFPIDATAKRASRRVPDVADPVRGGGRWALSWMTADGPENVATRDEPDALALEIGWGRGTRGAGNEKRGTRRGTRRKTREKAKDDAEDAEDAVEDAEDAVEPVGSIDTNAVAAARALVERIRRRRRAVVRAGVCPSKTRANDADAAGDAADALSDVPSAVFASAVAESSSRPTPSWVPAGTDDSADRCNAFAPFGSSRDVDVFVDGEATRCVVPSLRRRDDRSESRPGPEFSCDASFAASDAYPYPAGDAVVLRMSSRERAAFDARRAFYRGAYEEMLRAKTDFRVSVSLGSDATPVSATARFRGVSSFRDCARRKSLRVNLRGKTPRRLSRGAASDKFLLVSMCYDDRYVKTALVSSMASKLELFPLARAYVRLVVENPFDEDDPRRRWENEGLYLLVDDPVAAAERSSARLAALVRRRNDARRSTQPLKGTPDVKRPKRSSDDSSSFDAADRALARYDDVARVASTCRPGTCLDALDALVDVDEYLRLLALMTMVRSGDYVDEVWFYASEELVGARWRFRAHAWDPDDAFQACHHDGENALEDPNGILYCAEGRLDAALLRDEAVYAAFVDALEWTLREGMREETVDAIAETQLEEMFALLSDDDTAAGLAELVALKPENAIAANAREDIRGSMRWYLWLMRERRRLLLRRVAAYRSARADRRRVAIRERTEPRRVVDEDANEGDFDAFAFASSSKTFHVESKDASLTFGPVRVSASAAGVTASATLREHAYDADAAQELIASDFRLRNDGEGTVYLGDGPGPTTTLRFSPTVVYDERAYAAWPETFRVACWRNAWDAGEDRDAAKKPKRVASETLGKCAVRVRTIARDANANANDGVVEDESNATALVDFRNRSVAIRFAPAPGPNASRAFALAPGREFVVEGKMSLFHENWLPFRWGVAAKNIVGDPDVTLVA